MRKLQTLKSESSKLEVFEVIRQLSEFISGKGVKADVEKVEDCFNIYVRHYAGDEDTPELKANELLKVFNSLGVAEEVDIVETGYGFKIVMGPDSQNAKLMEQYKESSESFYDCVICEDTFRGFGNNPWPIDNNPDARCCDECNMRYVVPARLKGLRKESVITEADERSEIEHEASNIILDKRYTWVFSVLNESGEYIEESIGNLTDAIDVLMNENGTFLVAFPYVDPKPGDDSVKLVFADNPGPVTLFNREEATIPKPNIPAPEAGPEEQPEVAEEAADTEEDQEVIEEGYGDYNKEDMPAWLLAQHWDDPNGNGDSLEYSLHNDGGQEDRLLYMIDEDQFYMDIHNNPIPIGPTTALGILDHYNRGLHNEATQPEEDQEVIEEQEEQPKEFDTVLEGVTDETRLHEDGTIHNHLMIENYIWAIREALGVPEYQAKQLAVETIMEDEIIGQVSDGEFEDMYHGQAYYIMEWPDYDPDMDYPRGNEFELNWKNVQEAIYAKYIEGSEFNPDQKDVASKLFKDIRDNLYFGGNFCESLLFHFEDDEAWFFYEMQDNILDRKEYCRSCGDQIGPDSGQDSDDSELCYSCYQDEYMSCPKCGREKEDEGDEYCEYCNDEMMEEEDDEYYDEAKKAEASTDNYVEDHYLTIQFKAAFVEANIPEDTEDVLKVYREHLAGIKKEAFKELHKLVRFYYEDSDHADYISDLVTESEAQKLMSYFESKEVTVKIKKMEV